MSTAKPDYTAVSVTLAARDAMRELAVEGTVAIRAKVSMSAAVRAALIHARSDPAGWAKAMAEAYENSDEEED